MKYSVNKQGIEIEVISIEKNSLEKHLTSSKILDHLKKISSKFHLDDGKYEFSSLPFNHLGELEDHLKSDFVPGLEYLDKEVNPILMGCSPFFIDFASGHVHNSIEDMSNEKWIELRRKLYNAQPLIALLSQNSPVVGDIKVADVRLVRGLASRFTDFESTNTAHYMSLALGLGGATLEVRIPSASSLTQILGIVALIRTLLEEETYVYQSANVQSAWDNVIRYGSSAINRILIPKGLSYQGVNLKEIVVKVTDLWKIYLSENIDLIKSIISQFSSRTQSDILEFYNFIAEGHSISDSIYEIISKEPNSELLSNKLRDFSIQTSKGKSIFQFLNKHPESFMPLIERAYSIEEINEIIEKMQKNPMLKSISQYNDYFSMFYRPDFQWLEGPVLSTIKKIIDQNEIETSKVEQGILEYLVNLKVLKIKDKMILRGENFLEIVQMFHDLELL